MKQCWIKLYILVLVVIVFLYCKIVYTFNFILSWVALFHVYKTWIFLQVGERRHFVQAHKLVIYTLGMYPCHATLGSSQYFTFRKEILAKLTYWVTYRMRQHIRCCKGKKWNFQHLDNAVPASNLLLGFSSVLAIYSRYLLHSTLSLCLFAKSWRTDYVV
jgi:hypothetical protein